MPLRCRSAPFSVARFCGELITDCVRVGFNHAPLFWYMNARIRAKSRLRQAGAPPGTAFVRARTSLINGLSNPAGGGQAFVVDDFTFVPEPAVLTALALTAAGAALRRRIRHHR